MGYRPSYISYQNREEKIYGQKMSDISFGLGNIASNGCGVIALYNVLLSKQSNTNFHYVKYEVILRGGLNAGGYLGANPITLIRILRTRFWNVRTIWGDNKPYSWMYASITAEAVVVLYRYKNSLAMHYVAGIKSDEKGKFIFYNCPFANGKEMDLIEYISEIKKNGATPMLIITAKNKMWWW
jgi:hypothetical protein